jgi:hypothetical protein
MLGETKGAAMPTMMQTKAATSAEQFLAYLSASDSTRDLASALSDVVLVRRRCAAPRAASRRAVGA